MSDTIWPGQKVAGHDAAISRVKRAQTTGMLGVPAGGRVGLATADAPPLIAISIFETL